MNTKNITYWESRRIDQSYDLIIVGAGISGLGFAYWATKLTDLKVLIIDKNINYSASRQNAGFLTSGSAAFYNKLIKEHGEIKGKEIWNFSKENIKLVEKIIKEEKLVDSTRFVKEGSFTLIEKKLDDESYIKSNFEKKEVADTHLSKLSNKNIYFDKDEASYDPNSFISELEQILLRKENVEKLNSVEVLRVSKVGTEFEVITNIGDLKSSKVFIATNSDDLLSSYQHPKLKIVRNRAQIASFKLSEKLIKSNSNFYDVENKVYFRFTGGNIVIGGLRILDTRNEETDKIGLNPKIQFGLEQYVKSYIDPKAQLLTKWSGIMGFSQAELPVVFIRDGLFSVGGFSGHGNGYSFLISKLLVEKVFFAKKSLELKFFYVS